MTAGRPVPSHPDEDSLRAAAVTHLARYAATSAGVRRVLLRRVDRWIASLPDREEAADTIAAARSAVDRVIARLTELGAINDAAFAETHAQVLRRSGLSTRAITARLVAKGIRAEQSHASRPEAAEDELAAALVLTRRRRIGPFRTGDQPGPEERRREFAILARAGFAPGVAREALATPPEEAEARIRALRQ